MLECGFVVRLLRDLETLLLGVERKLLERGLGEGISISAREWVATIELAERVECATVVVCG